MSAMATDIFGVDMTPAGTAAAKTSSVSVHEVSVSLTLKISLPSYNFDIKPYPKMQCVFRWGDG